MCGIAGIYSKKRANEFNSIIHSFFQQLKRRGPDDQGLYTTSINSHSSLLLLHTRLSIIDLSSAAKQPMQTEESDLIITYNGEIYNYLELKQELISAGYHFKNNSDTEVILNAYKKWGIDCLQKFNGPFAFALFDKAKNLLWLCRDRFGKKPLFYAYLNGDFYFASSSMALAKALNLKPNLNYISKGLKYWVYEDNTDIAPFEKLYALPPAHVLKMNLITSQSYLNKYYDLETAVSIINESISSQDLNDYLLEILNGAIDIRLRADVPLAISLSGGLDSSTLAALLSEKHPGVYGYTFGHPGEKNTEGPLVKLLTDKIKIFPEYVFPSPIEFSEALDKTLTAQEAPFPNLSIVAQYLVYEAAHHAGFKVMLGGQGGDEVFMGYRKYQLFYLKELIQEKKYLKMIPFLFSLSLILISESNRLKQFWQQRSRYQENSHFQSLLDLPTVNLELSQTQDLKQRQITDITSYSLPTLLRYEDRNSMGNSIESRLPFLDYRLVEFGLSLPTTLKLKKGYSKWILREMMDNKIPNEIRLARYKRGFDVHLNPSYLKKIGETIRHSLNDFQREIKPFLKKPININILFSDEILKQNPQRLSEAISLLWLARI